MNNNYYIDFEFLEGTQTKRFLGIPYGKTKPTIDIISVGIIDNNNREYYAVSKDFNLHEAWNRYDLKYNTGMGDANNLPPKKVYWIRDNVLKPIFDEWKMEMNSKIIRIGLPVSLNEMDFTYKNFKYCITQIGKTNKQIAKDIKKFIGSKVTIGNWDEIKDIFKPNFIGYYSAYDHVCLAWLYGKMIDLPSSFKMYTYDLKQLMDDKVDKLNINEPKLDVELILNSIKNNPYYPKEPNKHNSLSDAKFNKELHNFLKSI
jgi:hypothetical protein